GFAIPANMVRTVVASAMNGGKVSRPWGGADLQDVTAEMGETLGLDRPRGAILALVRAPDKPAREETQIKGRTPLTGAVVANVSPALADELGLGISAKGVAVVDVKGGPAAEIGFRKGDILLEVNGEKVANVKALQAALTKENGYWQLSIDRGGQVRSVRLGG